MPRSIKVAAAQVGAVHRTSKREHTLDRLVSLLEQAAAKGAQLVVYPETTLTTFFPRYLIENEEELDSYYEGEDITESPAVASLFKRANELHVDVYIGYAEKTTDGTRFNTCVYYSALQGVVLAKYRKSHLPGTVEPFTEEGAVQQLEKRYFAEGQTGFQAFRVPGLVPNAAKKSTKSTPETTAKQGDVMAGMLICNDRRWPEAWRAYGLQGTELIMCGYNSPAFAPQLWGLSEDNETVTAETMRNDAEYHHKLVMKANSYMNSCFSISAARSGVDDGKFPLIGCSCIVDPFGRIVAEAATEDDEVVFAEIDLDRCLPGKNSTFNFEKHRRPELYQRLVDQKGVVEPDLLES